MRNNKLKVTKEELQKILEKVRPITKEIPSFYPSVEQLDELLSSEEFKDQRVKEEILKYFVYCLTCAFDKDDDWHKNNPGKTRRTTDNLEKYLRTCVSKKSSVIPHVGLWSEKANTEEREDIQAAFEYIYEILFSGEYYKFTK